MPDDNPYFGLVIIQHFNRLKYLQLHLFLVFITSALVACQNTSESSTTTNKSNLSDSIPSSSAPTFVERQVAGFPVVLIVRTTTAQAYERPDFSAPVVAHYQKEDSLIFTNRITEGLTSKLLEGLTYKEPWLRVILPSQKMAWIYGAHVSFDAQAQQDLTNLVLYPRATALFGTSLAQQINIYQKEIKAISSLPGFRTLYSRAQRIKDSLEWQLNHYTQLQTSSSAADFFWLNELLDGLLLHYIPEQQKYYLFRDLATWQKLSQQTPAVEDDAFIEVLLACYPTDSIPYYYHGWQLPLEDKRLCSLLGSGIHTTILEKLATALDSATYFLPELQQIKENIIDDITTNSIYWMDQQAIKNELDNILQKNYPFLDRNNRVALKTKRSFLDSPEKHALVLNLFEGENSLND